MKTLFFLLCLLGAGISLPFDDESNNLTRDPLVGAPMGFLLEYNGFAFEKHFVTTEDGYILGLYRIPNEGKHPMFLQHGFVDSSATFAMNDPNQSLGFLAHSAGFDVWFGNSRGNEYSLNATFCIDCKKSDKFWDFSFDDMAKYDVPAVIDYVLSVTKQPKLAWVGHSQGTTQMFAALSINSALSAKLSSFSALAPVVYLNHPGGILLGTLSKLKTEFIVKKLGNIFPPGDHWLDKLVPGLCTLTPQICADFLFSLVGGGQSKQLNTTRIPRYLSHNPATTSVKDLCHWMQNTHNKYFEMYDYENAEKNRQHYGSPTPPRYPLNAITNVSIAFIYGGLDYMGDPTDVAQLLKEIPAASIGLDLFLPNLNHMDFVWGQNVTELVYEPLLKFASSKV